MNGFAPKITSIKGISERRRLPRLGKIRLGLKVKNKRPADCGCGPREGCFKCTHPVETSYFVVPPEIGKFYGDKPMELDIMAPVNDLNVVFPNAYKYYGSSRGLKCHGNLEIAYQLNEGKEIVEVACPCEHKDKECNASANLQVILYKINFGGVYQITSGSFNSMVDIPSGFEYTQCLVGRFAMVPLKLKRVPTITHHNGKPQKHYPLQIHLDTNSPEFINQLREQTTRILTGPQYALPPAEEIRPDLEGPVTAEWIDEEEKTEAVQDAPPNKPEESNIPICPITKMDINEGECEKCDQIASCTVMGKAQPEEKKPSVQSSSVEGNGEFTLCHSKGSHSGKKVFIKYCRTTCNQRKDCPVLAGLKK